MEPKKTKQFGLRLTEEELERYSTLAKETRVPFAQIIRILMEAAIEYYEEHESWPKEIAIIQKLSKTLPDLPPRDRDRRSLRHSDAYADAKKATVTKPKLRSKR